MVASLFMALAASSSAVTFTVDDASDAVDASPGDSTCATASGGCTVRAAVMETNALPGLDRIVLRAGIHELTILGAGEDLAATGDLDVLGDVEIVGAGMDITVLRAAAGFGDRLVHAPTAGQALTIERITLAGGVAPAAFPIGGGLLVQSGDLVLRSAAFRNNSAGGRGGGLSIRGNLTADAVEFTENSGGTGGGLEANQGSVLLTNALVARNSGGLGAGMAVRVSYGVVIADSAIRENRAWGDAGGLRVEGGGVLSRLVVEDNVAEASAGGASLEGYGDLTLEDSVVARNSSTDPVGGGGGLQLWGFVSVRRCLVADNTAARGAGIEVPSAAATLDRCAVVGNRASQLAGGIDIFSDRADIDIVNTTVSGNEAPEAAGLRVVEAAGARLFNCTITDNVATSGDGGGVWIDDDSEENVEMAHVILAGNRAATASVDCAGTVISLGHNLIGSSSGCIVTGDVSSNLVGVDPTLGPLADNGGPTPTHELLLGSPALDGGDPAGCVDGLGAPIALDQRGWIRPVDGDEDGTILCDIGALEQAPLPPPFEGLAIQRSVSLSGSGASPLVETVVAAGCRQAYWQLCPEAVETGALDGMRLGGEGSTTALHSVWFYEHSDATQTMKVQREGDDLVFSAQ